MKLINYKFIYKFIINFYKFTYFHILIYLIIFRCFNKIAKNNLNNFLLHVFYFLFALEVFFIIFFS